MRVFGASWDNHVERLAGNWRRLVGADDIVLVPGDVSWGMRLAEALPDLEWLSALPGRKVVVRGNHDYWWQSLAKLNALKLPGLHFIQNNHVFLDGTVAIGGARLWDFPFVKWRVGLGQEARPESDLARKRDEDPEKIRLREMGRLAASLRSLPPEAAVKVALTHYPPLGGDGEPTPLTDCINSFGVDFCVFGHVHAVAERCPGADLTLGKTRYVLAASDYLAHTPICLCEFEVPAGV
jgi:predicted phosphohydrolase